MSARAIAQSTDDTHDFLFLTHYAAGDAVDVVLRVQSTPLLAGLKASGHSVHRVTVPTELGGRCWLPNARFVMFHANDIHAARVAQFLKATSNIRTICLASDVYSAQAYLELDATTDVFVAPSTMHLNVLRSFLSTPVVLIPEGIDPIALPPPGSSQLTPDRNARILWFGYPESFAKSLGLVLPQAMARSGLPTEALTLITDGGEGLLPGAAVQRFDIDHFYRDSSVARHALLSHFSFDMHMNSHIKTENKLITALVRGLIPVFSATPNYLECARRYELEHLTFTGLDSLTDLLKAVAQESLPDVNFPAITRHIVAERSPERLAGLLLNRL